MKEPLILFGAGSHAKVVLDALICAGTPPDFAVDDAPEGDGLFGVRVISSSDHEWRRYGSFRFALAVGDNQNRRRIFEELKSKGGVPINVIHPAATVSPRAKLGLGIVVFAGAVINPDAIIGDNCIVNTSASIDHDCKLGAHAHICPGVHMAGDVTVGTGALIGVGTAILPGMTIGDWTTVGAGSVVNRDLPSNAVAFGCPAKVQRLLPLQPSA